MVKLIIIRHGFSVTNEQGRFAGRTDVPLNEIGKRQAEQCARYVSENYKIDRIYSSDLMRAYDTAKPLSSLTGLEITVKEDLREMYVGEWEGMLISDIRRIYPEQFEKWKRNDEDFRYNGGESLKEALIRAERVFDGIIKENDGKTVAVTTHGGLIQVIIDEWSKQNGITETAIVPNASISVAECDGGKIRLVTVGYDGHLTDKAPRFGEGV